MLCGCGGAGVGTINQAVCSNGCDVAQYCSGDDFCNKAGLLCTHKMEQCEDDGCAFYTAWLENMTDECQVCFDKLSCCKILPRPSQEYSNCLEDMDDCLDPDTRGGLKKTCHPSGGPPDFAV